MCFYFRENEDEAHSDYFVQRCGRLMKNRKSTLPRLSNFASYDNSNTTFPYNCRMKEYRKYRKRTSIFKHQFVLYQLVVYCMADARFSPFIIRLRAISRRPLKLVDDCHTVWVDGSCRPALRSSLTTYNDASGRRLDATWRHRSEA